MTEPAASTQKRKLEVLAINNDKKDVRRFDPSWWHIQTGCSIVSRAFQSDAIPREEPGARHRVLKELPGSAPEGRSTAVRRFPNPARRAGLHGPGR